MAKKSTSPWVYVGCGCACLVVLAAAGIGTLGFFGVQFARDLEKGFKDPAVREQRALETLGATALPDGYRAQMVFRVPLVFEMVVLSDGEPMQYDDERHQGDLRAENLGDNAFVFMSMRDMGDARGDFERLLEGNTRGLDNVDINLDFRSHGVLGRGDLELPPQELRYAVHSGEFREGGETRDGTYAVILVDCPKSSRVRAAFYWQKQQLEDLEGGENGDLEGTAYEEGLRTFMSHFNVCGESA